MCTLQFLQFDKFVIGLKILENNDKSVLSSRAAAYTTYLGLYGIYERYG